MALGGPLAVDEIGSNLTLGRSCFGEVDDEGSQVGGGFEDDFVTECFGHFSLCRCAAQLLGWTTSSVVAVRPEFCPLAVRVYFPGGAVSTIGGSVVLPPE